MDAHFEWLNSLIAGQVEDLKVPGAAVGIVHEGQIQTAVFGVTSVKNPLAVNEDTLFQIGSITKTFTAALALRLVEQGKLDLDVPTGSAKSDAVLPGRFVRSAVSGSWSMAVVSIGKSRL